MLSGTCRLNICLMKFRMTLPKCYLLEKFPMPISENKFRGAFFDQTKQEMVHYSTGDLKAFKRIGHEWRLEHLRFCQEIRVWARTAVADQSHQIRIDCNFIFPKEKVWTKAGKIRKFDASNRIKPLHDVLADILDVDDCYFYPGVSEKIFAEDGEPECVLILLTVTKIQGSIAARAQMLRQCQASLS